MSHLESDFYRHLLLNSTDLLTIIDEEGIYKYVGDSIEPWLGYKPEELVGTNVFELIHPDDLPGVLEAFEQIASRSKMQVTPFRYKSKYNGWRWLECTASNQTQNEAIRGYITNSRDITDTIAERAKKDLHQAYYRSLFEEHPDAVFSLDTQGYFKSVNRHFCQILGIPEEMMLQTHFTDFIHPDDIQTLHAAFWKAVAGTSQTIDLRITDTTATVKIVHVTLLPVHLNGTVIGVQGIAKDITEAVRSQRLIREHSEQLRKVLESVTEPFYALDAEWRFTFANQAYCEMIGETQESLLGLNIWEKFPELLHSEFYKKCLEVARNGKTVYLEEAYRTDKTIILHYSIFPFDGGTAIHFIDITAQNALKSELEKLSLVASKTINGVVIMDPAGKIEWVNDGFTRLTGYSKEEVIDLVPSMLLQGNGTDAETAKRIREKYESKLYFTEEVLNYRKNGEAYWVQIDVTPIKNSEGQLINYIAIQTDITEKKKAEAELVKLADDLYKQNLNLQQFTYMVSHNLRAPVANALGLGRLLRKFEPETLQYNTVLNKLEFSIGQLDNVIQDINDILSIRDADRTLPREQVNLLTITQEVLYAFQDEIIAENYFVRLAVDPTFEMLSNKAYLYSILYNLVSNAIKYRSPDRRLELNLCVRKDDRGFVYTVRDNGLGLDMQVVQNQLFKLYKRFHPNTHGKGIGLFLVKTQVETIGGKITVESSPGEGTTFTLFLGAKHV